jgi:hypothetical protein
VISVRKNEGGRPEISEKENDNEKSGMKALSACNAYQEDLWRNKM